MSISYKSCFRSLPLLKSLASEFSVPALAVINLIVLTNPDLSIYLSTEAICTIFVVASYTNLPTIRVLTIFLATLEWRCSETLVNKLAA